MSDHYHDASDVRLLKEMRTLAPADFEGWRGLNSIVARTDGTIPRKYRELIAVAVAVTTQCPYCIEAHTKAAKAAGATFDGHDFAVQALGYGIGLVLRVITADAGAGVAGPGSRMSEGKHPDSASAIRQMQVMGTGRLHAFVICPPEPQPWARQASCRRSPGNSARCSKSKAGSSAASPGSCSQDRPSE